jgi:hypothetical protein
MTGGLLQLVTTGQQDEYINVNPDISFFKYAYKKHSNFSMESIQLTFDINPILSPTTLSGGYFCKILRYGDLVKDLYLCFTLPEVYSSDKYKFRWVENIGSLYIKKITVSVGGSIIDTLTGEYITIKNQLNSETDKDNYDILSGNVNEIINPTMNKPLIGIRNNRFIYTYYPYSDKSSNIPSIPSKQIIIPLNFWFSKNPSLSLPLLKLQYSDVYINLEPEISENLYQVYSEELERYISPLYYNELYNDNININTFVKNINIYPYIEANYIFINNDERNMMINTPTTEYLVEQIEYGTAIRTPALTDSSVTIDLNNHKITKEIIWTIKRDDYYKFNTATNYTSSIPENKLYKPMNKASIIWNKTNNRVEERNADYFNLIQPYQHHSSVPKQGIYCYSFALFPDKDYPTGSYNASLVSTSLLIYTNGDHNNEDINKRLISMNKNTYNFDYLINVYSVQYNVYVITGGMGGMKFA